MVDVHPAAWSQTDVQGAFPDTRSIEQLLASRYFGGAPPSGERGGRQRVRSNSANCSKRTGTRIRTLASATSPSPGSSGSRVVCTKGRTPSMSRSICMVFGEADDRNEWVESGRAAIARGRERRRVVSERHRRIDIKR